MRFSGISGGLKKVAACGIQGGVVAQSVTFYTPASVVPSHFHREQPTAKSGHRRQ